jgi:2-oxoglutarate/2-oxoacid ferredoxin oxidoreductase subunit alpha
MVVMNGNQAVALGAIASGMTLIAMYPITPATSVSFMLGDIFESSAASCTRRRTRSPPRASRSAPRTPASRLHGHLGPGLALKTEFLGLAVMTETPLVVVDVQRGGPSTGLPTKVEQSDLLAVLFGQPGDAPKW